jgi:hypothetical protein
MDAFPIFLFKSPPPSLFQYLSIFWIHSTPSDSAASLFYYSALQLSTSEISEEEPVSPLQLKGVSRRAKPRIILPLGLQAHPQTW